jgi:hypothetical protein
MKEKTIVIATVLAATTMLMAAFAVIPAEASQDSNTVIGCGNDFEPVDVFCQTLTSQIIGYDNDVTIDGDQGDD